MVRIVKKFENISSWEDINNLFGSKKSTLIQKLVSEFGVFKGYSNADIKLSFEFSKNNFRESYHKQKVNYEQFAKMFSVFDRVVKNAVGIESHNRNVDGYKTDVTLKNVYVLMSAFEDGDLIVPVKLEVKEFKDKQNTLYVAISLEGIKKTEVSKQGTTENGVAQNSRSVNIIIRDLFSKINPKDINFLKYIPDEFLNKEQIAAKANVKENSEKLYSERDYPVDPDVDNTVKNAYASTKGTMHELSNITADQNKAINRLVNQTKDNSYRGKFEGGKHRFSDTAIRHIIAEHGDFLREGLRAQLPMTLTDIARHLSAIKDNKNPSSIKATKTKQGNPSILTSYEVNGYTLYAEEITKPLGQNKPNDLIGHTMYKAPTLSTAAFYTTSVQTQPKRQSEVLCEYYMPNSTDLSMGNFVADKNGNPVQLYFVSKNGSATSKPSVECLYPSASS